MDENIIHTEIETHPWAPFIPDGARYLIMGTFPPAPNRWSMDFYYPNPINDFWRIMGLIYYNNKDYFWNLENKAFKLNEIVSFLNDKKIALSDTAQKVRRLKGNASDKFLEIVQPVQLFNLLDKMPECHCIATTGEKAAQVVAEITGTHVPKMGEKVMYGDLSIWRMPSTSRAYPMKLTDKAAYYSKLLTR